MPTQAVALFNPTRQQGMATLLLIILMGLGLAATTLSVVYSVRSVQEKQLSNHANTEAQQLVWTSIEAVRKYLATLDEAALKNLLTGSGQTNDLISDEAISATLTKCENGCAFTEDEKKLPDYASYAYEVRAEIQAGIALNTPAASYSQLEAVYWISFDNTNGGGGGGSGGGGNGSGSGTTLGAVNIYRDLNLTGDITVSGYSNAVFNVDGNVSMQGSVSGVKTINATGNVNITSAINVNNIKANGNVELGGSATVTESIESMGTVTLKGGAAKAGSIKANGSVYLSGGSATVSGSIVSLGNVEVTGGSASAATIQALGYVNWTSSANAKSIIAGKYVNYNGGDSSTRIEANEYATFAGAGASSVIAQGNVSLTYGSLGSVYTSGSLSSTGGAVGSGIVGGTISCPSWKPCPGVVQQSGYVASPTQLSLTPVTAISMTRPTVDVYLLQSEANYLFTVDSSGYRKVTVQNVNGIPAGTYFLGSYSSNSDGYKDYLCEAVRGSSGDPTCSTPAAPNQPYSSTKGTGAEVLPKTICRGFSNYNGCVTYNSGTWTLNGTGFAPGVLWFNGNILAQNGTYYNSMMATGNISTGGSLKAYAVNYAGTYPVCQNANDTQSGSATYNIYPNPYTRFAGLYPTAYCGTTSPPEMLSQAALPTIGNFVFVAGGYVGSTYTGGNITLGASNTLFGNLLSGNSLNTGGSTTVHGTITIANTTNTSSNWGGSTKIDLSNLPGTFDPDPCLQDCNPDPEDEENEDENTHSVIVRWSRYQ